jgi:hypothetical protein
MAFTYVDPSTNNRDKVRFLLGDTNSADPLFQDSEIAYLLSEWVDVYEAARQGCFVLIAKFTRLADSFSKSVGDISVSESYANKSIEYKLLADNLLQRKMLKAPPRPRANADALKSTDDRNVTDYHTDAWVGVHDNPNQGIDSRRLD